MRSRPMATLRAGLHITVLILTSVSLLCTPLQARASGAGQEGPTWTFMVYMAADSEQELPWEDDLNEMEAAGPPDWLQVLVLADPRGYGDSVLLEIEGDESPVVVSPQVDDMGTVIPSSGEVDMTSPDTLTDFITFAADNYPADRYALVLWGHGGGWYGLCADGTSLLRLPDLGQAMDSAKDAIGRNLDIIIADSCAEGVLETMYELRGAADWYVGSEISVPAQGLRYDLVLGALAEDRAVPPGDLGARICEIHRATLYYDSWSAAMATYDLGALGAFVEGFAGLSSSLEGYAGLYREELSDVLNLTARSDFTEWYLDVGDLLDRLTSPDLPLDVRHLALGALLEYDDLVYDFELYASPYDDPETVSDYTGAVVYAPSASSSDAQYWSVSFSEVGWGDATALIRNGEPATADLPGPEVTYTDTDDDGRPDQATLTWDTDHDLHTALVFAETPAGMQLLASLESDMPEVVISGVQGHLMVSASAWDLGEVVSHDEAELVLCGEVGIRVLVFEDGQPVTEVWEVRVVTGNGNLSLTASEGHFTGEVRVPEDAEYGELLTVEVLGTGGIVLGQNRTFVQGDEVVLEVSITPEALPGPDLPGVFLAALGVCVGGLLALAFLWRRRRGGP